MGRTDVCDLIFDKAIEGRRVRKLAKQITTIEPIARKAGSPQVARITAKPMRAARQVEGQMEMVL